MKNNEIITVIFSILILVACNETSDEVKDSLLSRKINEYYGRNSCVEKSAAHFILENINEKGSSFCPNVEKALGGVVESIEEPLIYNKIFQALQDSAYQGKIDEQFEFDYEYIKSEELIEHIDITYKNYELLYELNPVSFNEYCEYILPYRVTNEPIDLGVTPYFEEKYHYVLDSLLTGADFEEVISGFIAQMKFYTRGSISSLYPFSFSAYNTSVIRNVPICDDGVICLCAIFRSLGLPLARDFTPQMASHHSLGHSWIAIKWQGEWYPFDAIGGKPLRSIYKNASVPKILRSGFTKTIDVTNEYKEGVDVSVRVHTKVNRKNVAVAVFNKSSMFKVVSQGHYFAGKMRFKDLGTNVLYFPGHVVQTRFQTIGDPFYIDTLGNVTKLFPQDSYDSIRISRKYPLWVWRNKRMQKFVRSVNGSEIIARRAGVGDVKDTLFRFKDIESPIEINYPLDTNNFYSSVWLRSYGDSWISELHFWDTNDVELKGKELNYGLRNGTAHKIFDNEILTFSGSKYPFSLGYIFDKPVSLGSVSLQPRNDGNHIEIGDEYELLYWDKEWKSFVRQFADKNYIVCKGLPRGTTYWLRNLTKGKEELPFLLTDDGQQFWPGQ